MERSGTRVYKNIRISRVRATFLRRELEIVVDTSLPSHLIQVLLTVSFMSMVQVLQARPQPRHSSTVAEVFLFAKHCAFLA